MFEAGIRYPVQTLVCTAGGSETDINAKCNQTFLPGKIYEIQYTVNPGIKREDLGKMYDLIKQIESRYPGIGINYISVSDDGKTVTVQVFDPEELGINLVAIVIIVIFVAITAIFNYLTVTKVVTFLGELGRIVPKPPPSPWMGALFWGSISLAIGGAGLYMIAKSLKKK